ncbi:MAG TPA: Holliday junction resolvase RuvX [Actinomycetales bacterium]|nr:Holliday junction resolvase RuvX [Actinomycetales bacterium]
MRRGVRLGVDVGTVRVGLAVCDPDGVIASPLETLPRDDRGQSDIARIADEVAQRGVIEVVVGLPRSLDGRDRAAAEVARGYAVRLAGRVAPVPVRLVDERLSTVGAHRALHDAGVKGRRHRRVVDQVAAVLILQTALDAERASGRVPGSVVDPARAQEEA